MYVCGIDPGRKGGLAIIRDGRVLDLCRMPLCSKTPTGYDVGEIGRWIWHWNNEASIGRLPFTWWIEHVGAMPGDGRVSAFTFGAGWGGMVWAIHVLTGAPPHLARPNAWKRIMLGKGRHTKADSILAASRLFPKADLIPGRCRKPHDGIAEALLIAAYGARIEKG